MKTEASAETTETCTKTERSPRHERICKTLCDLGLTGLEPVLCDLADVADKFEASQAHLTERRDAEAHAAGSKKHK